MRLEGQHLVASASPEVDDKRYTTITARTGDCFCAENEFLPDIIKVDIEGYEYECFKGLTKTIDRGRPIIFLELHPEMLPEHGHSPADIAAFFSEKSYQFYNLNRQPLNYSDIERTMKGCRLLIQPMELGSI